MEKESPEPARKLNLFSRVSIVILFSVGMITLVWRDHFMLGSILIVSRWFLVALALIMLYITYKRAASKYFKLMIVIVIVIIPLEYLWCKINENTLRTDAVNTELVIMTYNVFFRNAQPKSAVGQIRNCQPDVLVVQELTPEWDDILNSSVRKKLPYSRTIPLRGTHGIGVYSKFPILNHKLLKNESNKPFAQLVELEIGKKKVQIVNVHLASPAIAVEDPENFFEHFGMNYKLRTQQLEKIAALTNNDGFDVQILVGDLNTTPYEPLYRDLKKSWVNLYDDAGVGNGHTFPNSQKMKPLLTLDYIFGRGNLKGVEVRSVEGGSSDHLALVGKIKI